MNSTSLWHTWEQTAAAAPSEAAVIQARDGTVHSRQTLTAAASVLTDRVPPALASGQVAAFAEGNGSRWLAMFLALQKLGVVAMPLDASLPSGQWAPAAAQLGAHWLWLPDSSWEPLPTTAPRLAGDFCLVKTTSGTSGQPRPLAFTSDNMLADGRQITATMGIGPRDRNLGAIPFGHSYGLGNLVLPLIVQGNAVVASEEILPDALAMQIDHHQITVFPTVPAVLRALAESSVDPAALRSLRRVISAGAPLRGDVAAAFHAKFGVLVQNFYGSSETGGICFDRTGDATTTGRSIGQPLDGVEVRLDEEGRVTVRSAAVVAPGEHTLADLGAWNERGELVLTGRATPLANIGGKKVAPLEIERVLRGLDGVTDAWVGVGSRGSGGGDFLLAAVETARSRIEVQQELAGRVPAWQLPRQWWVAPQLPRTARGKLDRRELEARCVRNDL